MKKKISSCLTCGTKFIKKHSRHTFCCRKCFKKHYRMHKDVETLPVYICHVCLHKTELEFDPKKDYGLLKLFRCSKCGSSNCE